MSNAVMENFVAECRRAAGPAVIEARGLTEQEASDAAQRLGKEDFAVRLLDGAAFSSEKALLDAIAAAFQFPGYFGRNWDALIDCWSDMAWLPASGYLCIIEKADVLERTHKDALDGLRNAAGHIAERWKNEDPAFRRSDEDVLFKLALIYDTRE